LHRPEIGVDQSFLGSDNDLCVRSDAEQGSDVCRAFGRHDGERVDGTFSVLLFHLLRVSPALFAAVASQGERSVMKGSIFLVTKVRWGDVIDLIGWSDRSVWH
jgi:hypothetical protein